MSNNIRIVHSLAPDQVLILDTYLREAIGRGEWLTRIQYRYKPQYTKIAKLLDHGRCLMAIAYDGTTIVGSMCAHFPMLPFQKHTVKFRKLLVIPPYRGQGIATHLFQELEDAVRAAGKTTVWFRYHRDNPAKNLYKALGYTVTNHLDSRRIWIRAEKNLQ